MAEIERIVEDGFITYEGCIKCKTITGAPHNNLYASVAVYNPTKMYIGTLSGLYEIKIEDIVDIVKAALEEANKGA